MPFASFCTNDLVVDCVDSVWMFCVTEPCFWYETDTLLRSLQERDYLKLLDKDGDGQAEWTDAQ